MARKQIPSLASLTVLALLLPPESVAFMLPSTLDILPPWSSASSSARTRSRVVAESDGGSGAGGTGGGIRRLGPRPLLASSKPDVKDTSSIISEMQEWTKLVTFDTHISRNTKYIVSEGTSVPEVLLDFWRAVAAAIDEHRATPEDRPFRKLLMLVSPYCKELRDYETMEHAHQLLEQSARDGGCTDFGKAITHSHYHPNYRHRPKPKHSRIASRHSPYPAFSIDVVYRKGGLKSLATIRAEADRDGRGGATLPRGGPRRAKPSAVPPQRPRTAGSASPEEQRKMEIALKKKEEWAAKTRSSLEHTYGMPASYGREEEQTYKQQAQGDGSSLKARRAAAAHHHQHALAGRGVPESSQEIMHATQAWLTEALRDAAESDAEAAAAALKAASAAAATTGDDNKASRRPNTSSPQPSVAAALAANRSPPYSGPGGGLDMERSTSFSPPTAAEAIAAAAAATLEEEEVAAAGGIRAAKLTRAITSSNSRAAAAAAAAAAATAIPGGHHTAIGTQDKNVSNSNDNRHEEQSTQPHHHTPSVVRFRAATTSVAGGLRQAFAHAADFVSVHGNNNNNNHHQQQDEQQQVAAISGDSNGGGGSVQTVEKVEAEEESGAAGQRNDASTTAEVPRLSPVAEKGAVAPVAAEGAPQTGTSRDGSEGNLEETAEEVGSLPPVTPVVPGKELVKRMKEISQFVVARSETGEEAYFDVWEVIAEMAGRAASRGCNVPTQDLGSGTAPCYGALMVVPDLATYSSDTFFRFQETLNRGLKHLPMEHEISVEAFHPEAVSEKTPLDHRFTRSPFPTLHICYHGLRDEEKRAASVARARAGRRKRSRRRREGGGEEEG